MAGNRALAFVFIALAALLLLAPLASAETAQSDLGNGFDKLSQTVGDQMNTFVYGTASFAQGIPNILGAFGAGSCEDPVAGSQGGAVPAIGLWLAPAAFVVLIVLMGVGIIYMLGQLFSSPNLVAIAKEEAVQTGRTSLQIVFIVACLLAANTWYSLSAAGTNDPIYSKYPVMIDGAMAFSRLMVSEMVTHYSMLLMYNTVVHTIYSSTMWIGITWRAMYSFNLGPVLKPLIDVVGMSLQFLSLGMTEWLLHTIILCMIKKYMWGFFIPLGVLMRAFPYTRHGGEALLSLSFALVLLYPFMFLFSYEAHKIMSYNLVDAHNAVGSFIQKSGLLNVFGSVLVVMFLMAGVFMPFFLGGALTLAFELIRGAVYYIVIMSVLIPFISIFITLTAAREMARFSGVDVNFMAFLKII